MTTAGRDRTPLVGARLRAALPTGWDLLLLDTTGSTNAEAAAAARAGQPAGLVVVAELQTAGRGRLDRAWTSPRGAGLTFSLLLRPSVPPERWALLPLLTGLAVRDAVTWCGVPAGLKWPNDVLATDGRKLAGVLAEVVGAAAVVGVGLNVTTDAAELPPTATSLALCAAARLDRQEVLVRLLDRFAARYDAWLAAGGDGGTLLAEYRTVCTTLGRPVQLDRSGAPPVSGVAVDVTEDGALVVRDPDGRTAAWSSGDVRHVGAG